MQSIIERNMDAAAHYRVSIIIATYNAAERLRACLASIAAQPSAIEIIVVDGDSTDQTISILEQERHPALSWVSEPDRGIYDALNKGIDRASGEWLYFMGSDDLLLPGFSTLVDKLQSADTVYYGIPGAYYLPGKRPDYKLLTGKFSKYRLAKYPLNHQAVLYPSLVFKKYRYSLRYPVFADYALNMQVWGDPDFKRKFLPIPLVLYNMTGFSSSLKDFPFQQDKAKLIRENLGALVYWRWVLKFYKKKFRGETF